MVQSQREVRILLVGEPGVGKTSLILSLVSEEFPEDVPPRSEEITIPADVTPEKVPTHIVDYSSLEQGEDQLASEIHRAHVICVVYAVDDDETLDKVTDHWLPLIRRILGETHSTPVVLVGNKVDTVDYSTLETVMPIMNEFAEIETCVECSARTLKNISELFFYAQKAILHPTAPLYNVATGDLTEACRVALTRVFRLCDLNNDGLLSDDELNVFQTRCFNAPLQPQALRDVKCIVQKQVSDGVLHGALTLPGFLFLHCLFVQRGRLETTWTVLRRFGYGDDVCVTDQYLYPPLALRPGCSTELSHRALQFLQALFDKHDTDADGCLSPQELVQLFSTCPRQPWGNTVYNSVPTDHRGFLTLEGYLCQWYAWALVSPSLVLEFLGYLGYSYIMETSQSDAITVTREKCVDLRKKQSSRCVYRCHVFGAPGVGKTSFCQGILGRNIQSTSQLLSCDLGRYTINCVPVYGQSKYLLVREVQLSAGSTAACGEVPADCDVACIVYDAADQNSFSAAAQIYRRHLSGSTVPCLFVGNKTDVDIVRQRFDSTPVEFCQKQRLSPPLPFSCTGHVRHDVYVKLATMATYPHLRGLSLLPGDRVGWLRVGLGLAAVVCGGLLLVRITANSSTCARHVH